MINRDKYLKQLTDNRSNGFPKIITGIRRCGKSFLIKEIYREYLLKQDVPADNILIIDLDNDLNIMYRDPIYLGEYVRSYCKGKGDFVVFIDEIQLVYPLINPSLTDGKHIIAKKKDTEVVTFVDVILGLSREKNIDLYVSGSNSRMLSSDIVTEFRDKAINIEVNPLSFEEYFSYTGGNSSKALDEYMLYGGMPLAVLKKDEEDKKNYLKNLFETTYIKDIVEHNHLRRSHSLDELCNLISETSGSLMNSNKIAKTYRSNKHENIDALTIDKYIDCFIDSFILREARRFDIKGRSEIGALRKYYFTDVGLRNARVNFAYPDKGQILENIVYNELIYHGYTVNIGVFDSIEKDVQGKSVRKTNEIDFFVRKNSNQFYIQVSDDISLTETRMRELRPYLLLNDSVRKIIIINKPIKECLDENGFIIIGIEDFLLRFIKD